MVNITEPDLNRPDNGYIDLIEGEHWKTIDEFPNYIISDKGRVFSKKYRKIIKPFFCPFKNNSLYYYVNCVNADGKPRNRKLHKIIASAFVRNTENKPIVHHIDGNRLNNEADNLMWVTEKEHHELHRQMKEKAQK